MAARATWSPDRRDVIWIDFNPQIGRECGLPMTTAEFNEQNPFAVKLTSPEESGELHPCSPAQVC